MLHNVVSAAMENCDFDIEILALKVCDHLSYNALCPKIERHVKTRWLSLHPAIEKN